MRLRAGLVMSLLLGVPVQSQAFTGETMCQAPETSADEVDSFDSEMCAPGTPHLLRMPNLDLCAPVSGKPFGDEAYLVAERALKRARELEGQGQYDEALLHYRVIEATLPRIRDYGAIMRAELHERAGDPARAAKAYREALASSVNVDLMASAHVELVRNLLAAGEASAEKELETLLRRYPELPEAPVLKLELGRFREIHGSLRSAASTYRMLDLTLPGYPVAAAARTRLEALRAQGVAIAPYSRDERFARAQLLVRSGPVELARTALSELSAEKLTFAQQSVLGGMHASLLRVDASAKPLAVPAGDDSQDRLDQEARQKRVRALISKKARIGKQKPFVLLSILDAAREEHMTDVADVIVLELARRGASIPADARFDALSLSSGSASDTALLGLADTLLNHPSMGAAARYHRGRALERMGRLDEAKADFARVQSEDRGVTHFYANLSEQRLRALGGEHSGQACAQGMPLAACAKPVHSKALNALDTELAFDVSVATALLTPIAERHGAGYPWFARALDLTRIGEIAAASDELHEAYLAFRSATRRGALRAGREAVYRGASVVRPAPDPAMRRARLSLDMATRETLARAAGALGDYGTAAFFGGPRWAESHPHPYPHEVAQAARKHQVDPDLLFAVMRVESVYQSRIISYAGAVGLMQIMPRTGRLIANQLGQYDRTTTDLLDPQTNVDYAAWYLRTLLDRMDGQLPLAIASYNGGPHNVRKWIRGAGDQMPLDAFLERIPFTQTKRYVRRVLGYYVEYKALRGEKVELMAMSLPPERPSDVSF